MRIAEQSSAYAPISMRSCGMRARVASLAGVRRGDITWRRCNLGSRVSTSKCKSRQHAQVVVLDAFIGHIDEHRKARRERVDSIEQHRVDGVEPHTDCAIHLAYRGHALLRCRGELNDVRALAPYSGAGHAELAVIDSRWYVGASGLGPLWLRLVEGRSRCRRRRTARQQRGDQERGRTVHTE